MAGEKSPGEAESTARTPAQRTFGTRGIEPPAFGYGPPPTPDFGVEPPALADVAAPVDVYPAPPPTSARGPVVAVLAAIVGVLAIVLVLVVIGISSLPPLIDTSGESAPSDSDDSGQSGPSLVDPGSSGGAVEASLQATIDEYKTARDSGTLWATIPDTQFNRTALSAFLYLLTDLKLAASFGADTSDYLEQADELEQKLLNEEPLGSDISIKLSDRTFTYDGETGEGGYTAN